MDHYNGLPEPSDSLGLVWRRDYGDRGNTDPFQEKTEGIVMKGWHVATIVALIGIIGLFYAGLGRDPRSIPSVLVGTEAPSFTGPNVQTGETLSLDAYKGKVIVLNFWASGVRNAGWSIRTCCPLTDNSGIILTL